MSSLLKDICRKIGIKIISDNPKECIKMECVRLGLSYLETDMVYDYYQNNIGEFQINQKISFSFEKIVEMIIIKLQIATP